MAEEGKGKAETGKGKAEEKDEVENGTEGICPMYQVVFERTYDAGVKLREFSGIDVHGAHILDSFPSLSLTSILCCGYLTEQLDLPLVGVISCSQMAPKCVIQGSAASHVIRIHGDRRLVVIQCEYKLPNAEVSNGIISAILDFAQRHNSAGIITIEGMPREKVEDYDTVQYLSTSSQFAKVMKEQGHKPVTSGVIAGMTGLMLAEAPLHNQHVSCMLSSCLASHPDPRAAVSIIKAMKSFLECEVDTTDLESKANKIDEAVKSLLRDNQQQEELSSSFPDG
eukprot:CAMPEP_0119131592 /NCGR_PEP_ID=MMETSP1310-20130426/10466_1 /TAXON_ID=464262 /ORGANISM="Genus nov. species nov., Strain RCC2339" /LENGTH=281 /DNA_ID=CAMNT_0007122175 /DNA_START=132 /DNA_END=973 /DNA_ORIENTATION=+